MFGNLILNIHKLNYQLNHDKVSYEPFLDSTNVTNLEGFSFDNYMEVINKKGCYLNIGTIIYFVGLLDFETIQDNFEGVVNESDVVISTKNDIDCIYVSKSNEVFFCIGGDEPRKVFDDTSDFFKFIFEVLKIINGKFPSGNFINENFELSESFLNEVKKIDLDIINHEYLMEFLYY